MAGLQADFITGFKCQMFLNEGIWDPSYTFYWGSNNNNLPAFIGDMGLLAGQIRSVLSEQVSIIKLRYTAMMSPVGSTAMVPKYPGIAAFGSWSSQDPANGTGAGTSADAIISPAVPAAGGMPARPAVFNVAPSWDGMLVDIVAGAGGVLNLKYKRDFVIRGVSTALYDWQPNGSYALNAAGKGKFGQLLATLGNVRGAAPGKGAFNSNLAGSLCIKGRSFDPAVTNPVQIISAAADATGCYTVLTIFPASTPYAPGMHIHVHGVTGCDSAGLNGDGLVIATTPGGLTTPPTITINRKACCCKTAGQTYNINPTGVLTQIIYGLWADGQALATRSVKRNTGNTSAVGTRGRRRKCCRV